MNEEEGGVDDETTIDGCRNDETIIDAPTEKVSAPRIQDEESSR